MPRVGIAEPTTVTLNLEQGDWIEVKERLTYGEEQTLGSASLTTVHVTASNRMSGDTEVGVDMKKFAVARIATWVVDWSFVDHKKKRLAVNRPNIEALDPDIAAEINEALDTYIAEVEAKKGEKIIEIESKATSGS